MKQRLEWKVGLFVFIGLVLLGALLLGFNKGVSLFHPTYMIYLDSTDVGGLKPKAAVMMSGVEVGTVSAITLSSGGKSVTITLKIYREFVIYRDARFTLEQSGFLGDQHVAIQPTENAKGPFEDQEHATAEKPLSLQEMARSATGLVQRVDDTARRLNEAIDEVRRLLLNPESLTNLAVSASNLRTFSEKATHTIDHINAFVEANSPTLAQSSSNLMAFSEKLNDLAVDLRKLVNTNSEPITQAISNIEASTKSLKTLLAEIEAGKGLAGNVVKNERMAASFAGTLDNLSITSSNLNRLGLWGILWKKKVPKAAELAPEVLASPKQSSP